MPLAIVTNRDKLFTSLFWKELFKSLGTKLSYSTAYHPQSDGQLERLNQCLEGYLRCLAFQQPHSWSKWLALAEWWYNTSHHGVLKISPFEALYRYKHGCLVLLPREEGKVGAGAAFLQERPQLSQFIRENLLKAQNRMK